MFKVKEKLPKRPPSTKNTLITLVLWPIFAIAGIYFCAYLLMLSMLITNGSVDAQDPIDGMRAYVVYGLLSSALLLFVKNSITTLKKYLFFDVASSAIVIGLAINILVLVLAVAGLFSHAINAENQQKTSSCTSLDDQIERLNASVVPIETDLGTGTAFAIDDRGTLLTAYHVIEGAAKVKASYVSGEKSIKVLKRLPSYDLALLKINEKITDHLHLTNNYKMGDRLYAYGYPGNTFSAGAPSLSSGILSRILSNDDLRLNDKSTPKLLELIQTDMALNPGNSGGPVVNRCGVVGIVSIKSNVLQLNGIASEEGINFAISSRTTASVLDLPIDISPTY